MTFIAERPRVVVDASVAVELLLLPASAAASVLRRWSRQERMKLVPAHFWAETANALVVGSRVEPEMARGHLTDLVGAGVEVADRGLRGVGAAIELSARHGLSVYDALYVHLALDTDATLATLDGGMARAAHLEGIELEAL